jgi:arylsulfatase A-like enzyme
MDEVWRLFKIDRKETAVVSREFLDWLSRRRQPERPFFAFLNFFEAHYPYELPQKGRRRFAEKPRNTREARLLRDWRRLIEKGPTPKETRLARDAYDDCVADLDERLGSLLDELKRRSLLEKTWVIVTSDHGESFGENPGVYWHGTSLYQAQIHVPLVILPPAGDDRQPRVVAETVSARSLAASMVQMAGLSEGSPFPGETLERFWNGSTPASTVTASRANFAISEVVPLPSVDPYVPWRSRRPTWPLAALCNDEWTYIRREGNIREELFHIRRDPGQRRDLAADPALRSILERMRENLSRLTSGPLTAGRLNP